MSEVEIQPCGEVILADAIHVEAQCPRLYGAPPFSSFVRIDGDGCEIFGVVYSIQSGAFDPNRRTEALGLAPDELRRQMPQLEHVLRTTFAALLVGYRQDAPIRPYLPPQPPEIHRFIYPCTADEVLQLTESLEFLRVLLGAGDIPAEDVIAGAIRQSVAVRPSAKQRSFMVQCGKHLATLLKRDYERFEGIVRRLQAHEPSGPAYEEPMRVF